MAGWLACITLVLPLTAGEPALPDFSDGMPDVALVSKEKAGDQETLHLATSLGSREFSATLDRFLGEGWRRRILKPEEMTLAADKSRTSNAKVDLAVYANAGLPGIGIPIIHLKPKEAEADSHVEITVIRRKDWR
jgi:hypothetical protein